MGDPTITLQALQRPSAKLHNIDDKQSYRYHDLLVRQKHEKEKVRFGNILTYLFKLIFSKRGCVARV